jgi:hypothetical protein
MPRDAVIAANSLLDAVISQSTESTMPSNLAAMDLALAPLFDSGPDLDPGDVHGAAVVCIAWLAARAAESSDADPEVIIAELREFLDSFPTE